MFGFYIERKLLFPLLCCPPIRHNVVLSYVWNAWTCHHRRHVLTRELRKTTPHEHVPKYDPLTGCFVITTFPNRFLLADMLRWTMQSYVLSWITIVMLKSRQLICWNTSSHSTVPCGVRKQSLAHALARCALNRLHSSFVKRINAFNGSTAAFACISVCNAWTGVLFPLCGSKKFKPQKMRTSLIHVRSEFGIVL